MNFIVLKVFFDCRFMHSFIRRPSSIINYKAKETTITSPLALCVCNLFKSDVTAGTFSYKNLGKSLQKNSHDRSKILAAGIIPNCHYRYTLFETGSSSTKLSAMKRSKFSWKKLFGIKQTNNGIPGFSNSSDSSSNTLERLREMEDLLQRKQNHLETRIEELVAEARKHGTKNKRAALMALKRKKRLESELARIDGTLTTIELQREALESAKNNMQVLGAMRDATNVLKNAQKHVTADKVLDIMDEVNEQQEIAKEIADAMSNPIGFMNSSVDEFELEKELEELEQEELDKALIEVNSSVRDNAVPEGTHFSNGAEEGRKVVSDSKKDKDKEPKVDEDEKELQELAQWSI